MLLGQDAKPPVDADDLRCLAPVGSCWLRAVSLGQMMGCNSVKWGKYLRVFLSVETICTSGSLARDLSDWWLGLLGYFTFGGSSFVRLASRSRTFLTPLELDDEEQNPKGSRSYWKWPFLGFHIRSLVAVPDANPID